MSYILDALRRADAERERERGGVPGLHSMPIGSAAPMAPARPPWVAAALGAAALSLLGFLGWWLWPAAPAPEPAVAQPAAPTMALPSSPAVAAAPAVQPGADGVAAVPASPPPPALASPPAAPPAPTPTPTLTAPTLTGPAPPPARPALREPPPPAPPAQTPARPSAGAVGPADPPAAAPASAAFATPPSRPEDKVIAFEQLPEDVKRSLPPLAIGGAVYSDNPGSRLLMIGGQLLKEGDTAGPGVTLEQIRPRSAVLRWKDVRYEVRF